MSSNTHPTLAELRRSLEELESSMEFPVVPGELESWSRNVSEGVRGVAGLYPQVIEDLHEPQFVSIEQQALGLAARVHHLREEDARIAAGLAQLAADAQRLFDNAQALEPDEARLLCQAEALGQTGIALVVRMRKQEAEMETWLFEAFERDEGTVD